MNSRTNQEEAVYHASENPDIQVFRPRCYWHIGFERSGPLEERMSSVGKPDVERV